MSLISNIEELKKYVAVDANTNLKTLQPYIDEAEELFIKELISPEMYQEILDQYIVPDALSEEFTDLLPLIQRPLAHYAIFLFTNDGGLSLSNIGLHEQSNSNAHPAPQWKIDRLQKSKLNIADLLAEKLLEYLEKHQDDYPTWRDSDSNTQTEYFIKDAREFTKYVNINNSRRLFLKLKPYLNFVEEINLKKLTGSEQFEELKSAFKSGEITEPARKLINKLKPLLARLALLRALPEIRITLSERGIKIASYSDGINKKDAASDYQVKELARSHMEIATSLTDDLKLFLEQNVDDYPLYKESQAYKAKPVPGPRHIFPNDPNSKSFSV